MTKINLSIHPRNHPGTKDKTKSNTHRVKSKDAIGRRVKGLQGHLANHPHDSMSQARLAKLNQQLSGTR